MQGKVHAEAMAAVYVGIDVSKERLDGAVLDINLGDDRSFPVAHILSARSVPFLFASGYGGSGLEPPFDQATVLMKPSQNALAESLRRLLR